MMQGFGNMLRDSLELSRPELGLRIGLESSSSSKRISGIRISLRELFL